MHVAFFVYDSMNALDVVGPHEVLSRVPGVESVFVAEHAGPVRCDTGLALVADAAIADVPAPDIVFVPGWSGAPQTNLLNPGAVHDWLQTADRHSTWTASGCTGSVILASAGLLTGRRATTHWLALDLLARYGAIPTEERVVFDGKYATGAGVSAGIDMALALAAKVGGQSTAEAIQLGMEYDPEPPFDAGSRARAPMALVDAMQRVKNFIIFGQSKEAHT